MTNNQIQFVFFVLILLGLAIFLLWFFIFKVKHLRTPDVYMVDGGVKTGKSLVTVMLAVKQYRKNCVKTYIFNMFRRLINLFRKEKKAPIDMPMLYSNMPLYKVKYNKLTLDVLTWKVRIPYRSVCIMDEATLIADSMLGMAREKEKRAEFDKINEVLTLFLKTYGHQTHGGSCFYNSQNVVDLHFSYKRCTAVYLNVMKNRKYPFFCLLDVREMVHDESGDIKNTIDKDVDLDNRPLFVSKRWYKYYDRYYLDVLTKDLPLYVDYDVKKVEPKNKQVIKEIITLGNYEKIRLYNESQQKPKETPKNEKK